MKNSARSVRGFRGHSITMRQRKRAPPYSSRSALDSSGPAKQTMDSRRVPPLSAKQLGCSAHSWLAPSLEGQMPVKFDKYRC
jgi:hypothetical protein